MSMWHDLLELVDKSGATCLNEDPRAPASNLWTPGNAYVCRCVAHRAALADVTALLCSLYL